jgi:hypothetical protein
VRSGHTNRAPLRFGLFGEDYYVLRATAENADLLGARLTAIDGRPIAQVRAVARTLVGGVNGRRDTFGANFIESPEQLAALHVIAQGDHASYRFTLRDGRTITRRMNGEAPGPTRLAIGGPRIFFPERLATEGANWRTALAQSAAPWAFVDPDVSFRWRAAPELSALVLDFRSNSDMPDGHIADFLAEAQHEIDTRHPRNLIIDQRLDYPGGDLQTTRAFMQALPGEIPGRIFVLTSPWTFSAAIASTGYLKQAAPDRVSIVGDDVGDRLNFFAEGRSVVLPNSQVRVNYATQRDNYLNGCRGYSDCYPYIVQYPIALPTLAPDISAPWTVDAYLAGRDPGLEAVARALTASHWLKLFGTPVRSLGASTRGSGGAIGGA